MQSLHLVLQDFSRTSTHLLNSELPPLPHMYSSLSHQQNILLSTLLPLCLTTWSLCFLCSAVCVTTIRLCCWQLLQSRCQLIIHSHRSWERPDKLFHNTLELNVWINQETASTAWITTKAEPNFIPVPAQGRLYPPTLGKPTFSSVTEINPRPGHVNPQLLNTAGANNLKVAGQPLVSFCPHLVQSWRWHLGLPSSKLALQKSLLHLLSGTVSCQKNSKAGQRLSALTDQTGPLHTHVEWLHAILSSKNSYSLWVFWEGFKSSKKEAKKVTIHCTSAHLAAS